MDEPMSPDDTLPDEFYAADTIAEIDALPDATMQEFPVPRVQADRVRRKLMGSEEE